MEKLEEDVLEGKNILSGVDCNSCTISLLPSFLFSVC